MNRYKVGVGGLEQSLPDGQSTVASYHDDSAGKDFLVPCTLNRWLSGAIDRVSRYVYGRTAPVDCGETAYRSSIRRETGTVGRDGDIVHLDLTDGRKRIVFERLDLDANQSVKMWLLDLKYFAVSMW